MKELLFLARLLFSGSPKKVEKLEIVEMKHFPFEGYLSMSWCGRLITRKPGQIDVITKNHETIHLSQAKQYSSWLCFYAAYLFQWLKGNPLKKPFKSAYYTNPFEVEAYANEYEMDYCMGYTVDNLRGKYTFGKRRKRYMEAGGTPSLWKKYIRSI